MKKILVTLLCVSVCCGMMACNLFSTGSQKNTSSPSTSKSTVVSSYDETDVTIEYSEETEKFILQVQEGAQNAGEAQNADTAGYVFQGYIELGYYPQTKADHRAVAEMSELADADGYFTSTYDNERYAKISKAKVYGYRYDTSDDLAIEENSTYYFKVEPIKWQVFLSVPTSGQPRLYLISDTILNCHAYLDNTKYSYNAEKDRYTLNENPSLSANCWGYSDLRTWLNQDFYNKAFSASDRKLLVSRDTSTVTTSYRADDRTEYVWIPNSVEASLLVSHTALLSDYARCNNTFMSIYPKYYGNGRYWVSTLEPAEGSSYAYPNLASYCAPFVYDNTVNKVSLTGESVGSTFIGVRPVISVMFDAVTILQETEEE